MHIQFLYSKRKSYEEKSCQICFVHSSNFIIKNLVVFFKNEMFDGEHGPTDEYHITESIKEDSVHTVCDSIDIISMDDRKRRNSIEEIGKSTYDDDQYQSMGGAGLHRPRYIPVNCTFVYFSAILHEIDESFWKVFSNGYEEQRL